VLLGGGSKLPPLGKGKGGENDSGGGGFVWLYDTIGAKYDPVVVSTSTVPGRRAIFHGKYHQL